MNLVFYFFAENIMDEKRCTLLRITKYEKKAFNMKAYISIKNI